MKDLLNNLQTCLSFTLLKEFSASGKFCETFLQESDLKGMSYCFFASVFDRTVWQRLLTSSVGEVSGPGMAIFPLDGNRVPPISLDLLIIKSLKGFLELGADVWRRYIPLLLFRFFVSPTLVVDLAQYGALDVLLVVQRDSWLSLFRDIRSFRALASSSGLLYRFLVDHGLVARE